MAFGTDRTESSDEVVSGVPQPHHEANSSEAVQAVKPKGNLAKKHVCDVDGCSASFSRPWRLSAHKAVHFGEKPYRCTEPGCDKAFTASQHLARHKKNNHFTGNEAKQSFKCEFDGCEAEFKLKQNAQRHFKRTHVIKSCKICGKSFNKQSLLKTHEYEHSGEVPYKCNICDVGFYKLERFHRHERGHTEHICPIVGCYEAFKNWSHLRKHHHVHPPEFNCYYCKKPFRIKKHLKSHIKKHLALEGGPIKRKWSLNRHTCRICSASLLGTQSLKRHIKTVHNKAGKIDAEKKPRASRKDKGVAKNPMASTLSSVVVCDQLKTQLLSGESIPENHLVQAIINKDIVESEIVLVSESGSDIDCTLGKEISYSEY